MPLWSHLPLATEADRVTHRQCRALSSAGVAPDSALRCSSSGGPTVRAGPQCAKWLVCDELYSRLTHSHQHSLSLTRSDSLTHSLVRCHCCCRVTWMAGALACTGSCSQVPVQPTRTESSTCRYMSYSGVLALICRRHRTNCFDFTCLSWKYDHLMIRQVHQSS